MRRRHRHGRLRGVSAIETLIALPVLLLAGGGALQFALVLQARHALNHAVNEAARAGSVGHADPDAIHAGLARGLLPWLYGADDVAAWQANLLRARAHVEGTRASGRLRLVVQSPTQASFDDWSEPARDAAGAPLAGLRQIPNDDLVHRATRALPASGLAGTRRGEPVGAASGQTLADANLLRLRLDYAVPLSVPVVGRVIGWTLRAWHGCEAPSARRAGLVDLGTAGPGGSPRIEACTMLGTDGRPRLPVRVSATQRMQSPARFAGDGGDRAPVGAASAGPGGGRAGPAPRDGPVGGRPAPSSPPGPYAGDAPLAVSSSARPDGQRFGRPARDPGDADPAFCRQGPS
ncbi:MAG: hypothetical protein RJA99_592 [Pseudomonadota bacterium]|jgi:hypothetical protein